MRTALLLLLGSSLFAQGTVPTTGNWTAITGIGGWSAGSSATTIGYDKLEYVSSRKIHCVWGSSRINGQSEPNNANICFNYPENRWEVLSVSPMWANTHNPNNGHTTYGYVYMPGRDSIAYYAGDGSGNLVYQPFKMDWWWFDIGGLSGQNRQMDAAPWLPNGTPLGHGSIYDPVNDKIIIWPAHSPSGTVVTAVVDPAAGTYTLYTSAQTGGQPAQTDFVSFAWNSVTSKGYLTGGSSQNTYAWDTPSHTWTLLTTTCSGANCSGTAPPVRKWAGLACSTIDGGVCLFAGGITGSTPYTDTWIFDPAGPSWTQQTPAASYTNTVANANFHKVSYDADSNVFLLVQSNASNVWAFPYSTALGYGRTSNSYSPTSGSLNRSTPGATQSWAYGPSLAVNGSTLAAGWIESFSNTNTTSCANGSFHPYVQTTPNTGTWTGAPTGTQASACAAMDSEVSSATIAGSIKVAYVNGTLWSAWSKYSPSGGSIIHSAFAKSWNGSSWSGGAIGCFLTPGTCAAGDYQNIADLKANGTTPVAAVIEWTTGQFVPEGYGYVAQWNGSAWALIGSRLNLLSAGTGTRITSVALASDGTNPAACWIEERRGTGSRQAVLVTPPQISCAQWNGSSWARFGSAALNIGAGTYARDPAVTYVGSKFYISWTERTLSGNSKLYLCRWDGSSCTTLGGGALNINTSTGWAAHPQLDNDGTNVFLSWDEQTALGQKAQGHVAKWNGSAISAVGGAIAADTTNGSVEDLALAVVSGAPTVMWGELKYGNLRQIYTAQWNGSDWAGIGSAASSQPTTRTAGALSIKGSGVLK